MSLFEVVAVDPDQWDYTPVDISRALKIDGWMSDWELYWLAKQAAKHHTIVELGCFLGRSTRALADNTPGRVYAVDNFVAVPNLWGINGTYGSIKGFLDNMADLIVLDKVRVVPLDHAKCEQMRVEPDMVFIDGSHDYESVKRDIMIWREKLLPGGLICGHDYNLTDVTKAVTELLPDAKQVENTAEIWAWEDDRS